MSDSDGLVVQASAVAIDGRAMLIEGPPGSGKSSLALALIDRGAKLIGDDAVTLRRKGQQVIASPPPNIVGLIEVRGVGLVELMTAQPTMVGLIVQLGEASQKADRLPESVPTREILGVAVPALPFTPGAIAPAARAQMALRLHGLPAE